MCGTCRVERTHWTENRKSSVSPAKDGVEDVLHPERPLGIAVRDNAIPPSLGGARGQLLLPCPVPGSLPPSLPPRQRARLYFRTPFTPFMVFLGEVGLSSAGGCFHCSALSTGAAALPWGPGSGQGRWAQGWADMDVVVAVTAAPVLVGGDSREHPVLAPSSQGMRAVAPLALLPW